jgi:hypothetical protein
MKESTNRPTASLMWEMALFRHRGRINRRMETINQSADSDHTIAPTRMPVSNT